MTVGLNRSYSEGLIETFGFAQNMLQATFACLLWIDRDLNIEEAQREGLPQAMSDEWYGGCYRYDPLHPARLTERRERVAFLQRERAKQSATAKSIHTDFMSRYGIVDEVDFLLWRDDRPFAVFCAMKCVDDPPLEIDCFQWETMHRHLEFLLLQHPMAREVRKDEVLTDKFSLTAREIEVLGLLQIGASNAKIADVMGIAVATVKTYVVNILNKLGVDNRFAAAAYVSAI